MKRRKSKHEIINERAKWQKLKNDESKRNDGREENKQYEAIAKIINEEKEEIKWKAIEAIWKWHQKIEEKRSKISENISSNNKWNNEEVKSIREKNEKLNEENEEK